MGGAAGNELLHRGNQWLYAKVVGVAQGAAAERGESCAHDHGEINLCGFCDYLFFKATRRLIDHEENHALLKVVAGQRGGSPVLNEGTGLMIRLRRFPLAVQVKSASGLAPQQASLDHFS
jgi:hypothetical protein